MIFPVHDLPRWWTIMNSLGNILLDSLRLESFLGPIQMLPLLTLYLFPSTLFHLNVFTHLFSSKLSSIIVSSFFSFSLSLFLFLSISLSFLNSATQSVSSQPGQHARASLEVYSSVPGHIWCFLIHALLTAQNPCLFSHLLLPKLTFSKTTFSLFSPTLSLTFSLFSICVYYFSNVNAFSCPLFPFTLSFNTLQLNIPLLSSSNREVALVHLDYELLTMRHATEGLIFKSSFSLSSTKAEDLSLNMSLRRVSNHEPFQHVQLVKHRDRLIMDTQSFLVPVLSKLPMLLTQPIR